jgi:ADP-heptose:LPS heptosyltransferase
LQVGPAAANIPDGVLNLGDELVDFAETAAAISELDLVVTVDTAVAHLAGSLGKPVWLLLMYAPDWRWMLAREDTPWYPTMRLFRQTRPGEWGDVVERVVEELRRTAGNSPEPKPQ